jgi:Zn-dependent M28 family amino/carboxypeptidase
VIKPGNEHKPNKKDKEDEADVTNIKILLPIAILIICFISINTFLQAFPENNYDPGEYEAQAETIKNLGLSQEKAFEFLQILTSVGGRLTGSPQAEQAVRLMNKLMIELGFDRVWLEPVKVNHWIRGKLETGLIESQKLGQKKINICALGNSVGTPEEGIEAGVIEIKSWKELDSLQDRIKGKIVFYNVPMDRTIVDPFKAYGQAAQYRVKGASMAARYGAIASLTRSLTFRLDNYPHTGVMIYDEKLPKIPAASIATLDSNCLSHWLSVDPSLRIKLKLSCRQLDPVTSYNVIGELTGTEKPEEIILLGGHLDSWDLSPGANDDASGCVVALEALRLLKEAGLKPKRTVRAVLFMDEEFGGSGGKAYIMDNHRLREKHLLAIEQDRGGGLPLGLLIGKEEKVLNKLQPIKKILQSLGVNWIENGGGGVDISPLISSGVIPGSLIPNPQRYFDYHHSALDNLEAVHPRELELQAIILAIVCYYLAQEGV